MRLPWRRWYWHHCDDWRRPAGPCPPTITSDIGRQVWAIVGATPFDREAFGRVLMPYQPRMRAAESGAAHELEFYGGER